MARFSLSRSISGTPRASARARDFSRPAGLGKAKNCREALHRPPRGLANFGFTQIRRSQDIQTTVRFYGRLNSTIYAPRSTAVHFESHKIWCEAARGRGCVGA